MWKHNPLPDLLEKLLDKTYTVPRELRKNILQMDTYLEGYFVLQKVPSSSDVEFSHNGRKFFLLTLPG